MVNIGSVEHRSVDDAQREGDQECSVSEHGHFGGDTPYFKIERKIKRGQPRNRSLHQDAPGSNKHEVQRPGGIVFGAPLGFVERERRVRMKRERTKACACAKQALVILSDDDRAATQESIRRDLTSFDRGDPGSC